MYVKAEDVLPETLLEAIQEYVQGVELYIPKRPEERLGWGEVNGTRNQIHERNREIVRKAVKGESIHSLMEHYHLSYDSIRKIISASRKE
jgi:Mor family transcriptional regulator